MNMHLRIHQAARAKGLDLSKLSHGEYEKLALEIRDKKELFRDGWNRYSAHAEVKVFKHCVPLPILEYRTAKCKLNRCGSNDRLAGDVEVCHRCSCGGNDLEIKRRLPTSECPAGEWGKYVGPLLGQPGSEDVIAPDDLSKVE